MRSNQWLLISCLLILLSACAKPKGAFIDPNPYLGGKTDNFELSDPENSIILVYNKGTRNSHQKDNCSKYHAPQIWKDLAGKPINGKNFYIYYLCPTAETGYKYIDNRAQEIEQTLDKLIAKGVPTNQLFLGGHSAGAWSSLIVARNASDKFNSLIAFAPAFAGEWRDRHAVWWQKHHQEVAQLKETKSINALIYAFEEDEYNRVSDLEFFKTIPNVEFTTLPWEKIDGITCDGKRWEAHFTAFKTCFTKTQSLTIKTFIENSLQTNSDLTS